MRLKPVLAAVAATATLGSGAALVGPGHPAGAAQSSPAPPSGAWTVDGRGNGHGHGLSQYGARGAAIAGLSATRIVAFYYPGTRLTTLPAPSIRVRIGDQGPATTVRAASGLRIGGTPLHSAGVSRWRLVPSGSGLALQRLASGRWSTTRTGLPARADFSSSTGTVRLVHGDGTSTDYRGTIGAVRSVAGEITVNRLGLDDYVRGVAPREMPASWPAAAVQAQAVAARTYARYEVEHSGSAAFDICDDTNCQVYGGRARYDSGGRYVYGEDARSNDAVARTANRVLTYRGHAAFAQFAASNGGVMAAGGQPYLPGKADPYDNAASGDPYLGWTRSVPATQVASYYGLARVTGLDITARAGGGPWGGVVTRAAVHGTDRSGRARTLTVSGTSLAWAMDLPYSLFRLRASAPVGHVDAVSAAPKGSTRVVGWTLDPLHSGASTLVRIYVDGTARTFPAKLRRPDVQRALRAASAAHGFSATVPVPAGAHRVCVYGLDVTGKRRAALGCRTVQGPAPSSPPVPRALPAAIEGLADYAPQTSCDPTAKPGATALARLLTTTYRGSTTNIAYPCGTDGPVSEHYEGRAIDWMVSVRNHSQAVQAHAFVSWLLATDRAGHRYANARRLGVMYVVFDNRIWGAWDGAWHPHSSCAGHPETSWDTTCHRNHVHISLSWAGATKRTSYWTKHVAAQDYGPCRPRDLNWAAPYHWPNRRACPEFPPARAPAGASATLRALVTYSGATVHYGSAGPAVLAVQRALGVTRSGNFLDRTRATVRTFQSRHRLAVTGALDAATWRALLRAVR